jgi:hypothetical protein
MKRKLLGNFRFFILGKGNPRIPGKAGQSAAMRREGEYDETH